MNTRKPGYLYALHLTPCEIFVWNKLRSLAKKIDNQLRVAIPAAHEDIYLEWDPPDNIACDEHVLGSVVQKFCSAGVIIKIGDNEKGKIPYRFADDPGVFYVNPVDSHPEVTANPEFMALALKIMQGEFEEDSKRFQPHLQEWIERNSTIKPSSAYVKMVGVRFKGTPAVGIFFKNPKWQPGHATEKRRYLIAAPGFTAHKLVEQTKAQLKEKRKLAASKAHRKPAADETPIPSPEQFEVQTLEELQQTITGIEVDIDELVKMLAIKQKELAAAKSMLIQKLDEQLQNIENERRKLQALRDQQKVAK
ncbi:MAG: hypothetical protein P1P90_05745 [Patescibacteria group bacterium]|nr:hypothetical protein [Patescibacteria group bacterium]